MTPFKLSSLLSDLLAAGEGAIPLKISVRDDNEVVALKDRIAVLEGENEALKAEKNRTEFTLHCFYVQNQEMFDLLRDHGIKYKKPLFTGFD